MKYEIHYSPEALKDLDEIWEYIFAELYSPSAAEKAVNKIVGDIDNLEHFPESGPLLSSIADVESDCRFLVSGKYMTFYRFEEQNIYIDRILYGKRSYLRILFPDIFED